MTASNDPGGSAKPGKQRKRDAEATQQTRRKKMAAHLDEDLMLEFDRRSMPVREGDTVRIERGDFGGHEGEVLEVDHKRTEVEVDGVTNRRADGTQVPRPIHPSNLTITDLHLTDPQRRAALERKGVEVEAPPEPEPEEEEDEEAEEEPEAPEPATEPPAAEKGPDRPAPEPDEADEAEPDADETDEAPEDDADEAPEPDEADEPEPAEAEEADADEAPDDEPAADDADADEAADEAPDDAAEAEDSEVDRE